MMLSKPLLRNTALSLSISAIALLTSACGAQSTATLEGPEDAVAVFKQRCMQCHGTELQGKMGPETNLQKIGAKLTKEQIIFVIHNGGERMQAIRGISDDEVDKVATWLSTLQ